MPKHALFTEGSSGGKHRLVNEAFPGGQHAFYAIPGITDTFNRADGSDVAARSDGGLWTVGDLVTYEINSNKLIRTAPAGGIQTNITHSWLYADSGYSNTMTVTLVFSETTVFFGGLRFHFATNSAGNVGFFLNMDPSDGNIDLRRADTGLTIANTITHINWADGTNHTVIATYNASTGAITISLDGTTHISTTASSVPASSGVGLYHPRRFSNGGQAYDNIAVTGT